jgi:hypothetical protein
MVMIKAEESSVVDDDFFVDMDWLPLVSELRA